MTVSSTTKRNSYTGDGSTTTFAYSFKIFDDDDITVILRTTATGTESVQSKTTHYSVTGVGSASGGNVVFGSAPSSAQTVVLLRQTAQTQATDYTPNDPFPAASHEDALDKLTLMTQDQQDELDRSIKLSRANTMTSTEFTVTATNRANKIFAFDSSGELAVTQEIGTFTGNFAASTAYNVRDLIKDTSTNNIFIVNEAHTSSGSQPLTTNANSAKYDLIVDAASATTAASTATTKASEAATSATAAASSASSATSSASSATSSASTASTAATAAQTAQSAAETAETNAASSATGASNSATAAASSASTASGHATTATTKASEAATSATNAATSASTASTQATNASNSASTATTKASEASTSATNAASSATAAASSATAASASQTAAATSATSAASSAAAAQAAADFEVVNDTTPQLGGNLDLNSNNITGTGDITITGNVTATGTVEPAGDTSAGDNAAIGYTAAEGLILTGQGSTSDVVIKNDADTTVCFVPTGTDDLKFNDNAAILMGTGSDMQLIHDGSNSIITDNGTGNLVLRSNATAVEIDFNTDETAALFNHNGSVELYHDNSKKFETSSTGVSVTGQVIATKGSTGSLATFTDGVATNFTMKTDGSNVGTFGTEAGSTQLAFMVANSEKVRLDGSGNLGIGTTSPSKPLTVVGGDFSTVLLDNSNASHGTQILFQHNGTANTGCDIQMSDAGGMKIRTLAVEPISFHTSASAGSPGESFRVITSGNILQGKTSENIAVAGNEFGKSGYVQATRDGSTALYLNRLSNTGTIALFQQASNTKGSIDLSASGTTYTTTSDIRLKQDIEPLEATDKLMAMNPVSYAWKADPDGPRSMGFIAQEMQEIMPDAVSTGEDDDAMMSMDYGRITPILVSALQDAHKKIEELEIRIAAMESK